MKIVLTSVFSDVKFLFRTKWLTIRGIRETTAKPYGIELFTALLSFQRFGIFALSHPSPNNFLCELRGTGTSYVLFFAGKIPLRNVLISFL